MTIPNLSLDGTWSLDNIFGKGVPIIFSNSSGYTDASNGKVDETKLKDLNYMWGQADYYNALNPTQSLQYLGNSGYSRRHFAKTLQKGVRNSNWVDLNSDLLSQLKALGIDSEDSFNEFKGLGASGRWKLAKKALINANNNAFQQHAVQTRLYELIKNNLLFLSGLAAPVKPILSVQPEKPYTYNGIKEGVTDWNGNAEKIFGILGNDFVKLNVDTNGNGEIDQTEYNNFLQGLGQGRNFSDGKYGNASINGIINKYGITGDLLTQLQGLITKPVTPVKPSNEVIDPLEENPGSYEDPVLKSMNLKEALANQAKINQGYYNTENYITGENVWTKKENQFLDGFKYSGGDNWWNPQAFGTNGLMQDAAGNVFYPKSDGSRDYGSGWFHGITVGDRTFDGGNKGINHLDKSEDEFGKWYDSQVGHGDENAKKAAYKYWLKRTTGKSRSDFFKQGGKLITKKYK